MREGTRLTSELADLWPMPGGASGYRVYTARRGAGPSLGTGPGPTTELSTLYLSGTSRDRALTERPRALNPHCEARPRETGLTHDRITQ
jgi:hypothetical protein